MTRASSTCHGVRIFLAFLLAACLDALALPALGHELRPAYLELRQTAPERYEVLWKVPARSDLRLGLYVRFADDVRQLSVPRGELTDDAHVERWSVERTGGMAGARIVIDGLQSTLTDVLVRVEHNDGSTQVVRLLPAQPSFTVEAAPSAVDVARIYVWLGIEHILLGIDHLLFVAGLLFLVQGWRRVIGTITAFTAAHTITLAAATLGHLDVPGKPVEAAIALSIVFVAAEIVHGRRGRPGVTARWPWIVAFTFGLLHGLGFAGALSAAGLPPGAIPLALLCFNVGVELGQLAFVVVVVPLLLVARALTRRSTSTAVDPEVVCAYAIGAVAAFWLIERTTAFWSPL